MHLKGQMFPTLTMATMQPVKTVMNDKVRILETFSAFCLSADPDFFFNIESKFPNDILG
jgi:hypothetical protein